MRILYAGYRKWAYDLLKNLIRLQEGKTWKIVGVITTTEAEADFNELVNQCYIFTPTELKNPEFTSSPKFKKILELRPDVILFYGWSWKVPNELLKTAKCIGLHPSPLPKYRGGSPIQHQIIAGEKKSAVSLYYLEEELDSGDILAQKEFSLYGDLKDILARITKIGTILTAEVLDKMTRNELKPIPQNHSKATIYRRRKPEESEITLEEIKTKTARELYNKIRALQDPYPNAFIRCKNGTKLYIVKARLYKPKLKKPLKSGYKCTK